MSDSISVAQQPKGSGPSDVVMGCISGLSDMRKQYPEWFAEYDDSAVDTAADRSTIEAFMRTAPNEALRYMLFGKLVLRTQIAAITERPF